MNTALMEELLNEEESSELDFKRDQYPFAGAADREKSELLKDILAFANAWRRADAYILIGVDEVRGGRSTPVGVATHLNDNDLQQFVNSKTNRPVAFSYEAFTFEGVGLGVIRIEVQDRPTYITRDYGRLRANVVYVRRGSSTAEATPDEIFRMGAAVASGEASGGRPRLILTARAQGGGREIVLSLRNEGSGLARAPYLAFTVPQDFQVSPYGIDGNYRDGFLGPPQGHEHYRRPQFGGNTDRVIHPGTQHDIAVLRYYGNVNSLPKGDVVVSYETAAEGLERSVSEITIPLN